MFYVVKVNNQYADPSSLYSIPQILTLEELVSTLMWLHIEHNESPQVITL